MPEVRRTAPARRLTLTCLLATSLGAVLPSPGVEVNFTAPAYLGMVGKPVELAVEMKYAPGETPDLFSFGVKVMPVPAAIRVDALTVVPALDHSGFAQGALKSIPDAAAKGNVSISGAEVMGYTDTLLMRITVTPRQLGSYPLGLDFYRTAGPQEDIFVTTDGTTLDPAVVFGSSMLRVIDPPQLTVRRVPDEPLAEVSFSTLPGLRYTLRQGDDLRAWRPLSTVVGESSVAYFWDTSNRPVGFFQLQVELVEDG